MCVSLKNYHQRSDEIVSTFGSMSSSDANLLGCKSTVLAICTHDNGRSFSAMPNSHSATGSVWSVGLESAIDRWLSCVCRSRAKAAHRIHVLQSSDRPANGLLLQEARQDVAQSRAGFVSCHHRCCVAGELLGYVPIHDRSDVYYACGNQTQYGWTCVESWSTDRLLHTERSVVDSRRSMVSRTFASATAEIVTRLC